MNLWPWAGWFFGFTRISFIIGRFIRVACIVGASRRNRPVRSIGQQVTTVILAAEWEAPRLAERGGALYFPFAASGFPPLATQKTSMTAIKRLRWTCFLQLALFAWGAAPLRAHIIYIASNGDDQESGLLGEPVATLRAPGICPPGSESPRRIVFEEVLITTFPLRSMIGTRA